MNESIIIGLVVGGGVAVIGALLGHFLRRLEMKDQWDREQKRMEALWAEEDRRRKSDRRREIRGGLLGMVNDAVDAVIDVRTKLGSLGPLYGIEAKESRMKLAAEIILMLERGRSVVHSLEDEQLSEEFFKLYQSYVEWQGSLDFATGEAQEGKNKEFEKWEKKIPKVASLVRRRIREILEEV